MEAQKSRDKSLEETVRIENEVFQLVGCTMIKKVEVKSDDAKRIPYDIRQKARDLGGNVLNDLAMRESFQNQERRFLRWGKRNIRLCRCLSLSHLDESFSFNNFFFYQLQL